MPKAFEWLREQRGRLSLSMNQHGWLATVNLSTYEPATCAASTFDEAVTLAESAIIAIQAEHAARSGLAGAR